MASKGTIFIYNKQSTRKKPVDLTVKEKKLLGRVVSYYQHTFGTDSKGITFFKQQYGITNLQTFNDFHAGYANGTLLEILSIDETVISSLKKIGILNHKGHEHFNNCVVFPLYHADGSIVNLYGPDGHPKSPTCGHLKIPHLATKKMT